MSEAKSKPEAAPADPLAGVTVRSLIVPLNGTTLVLPNTAVAEVSDYKTPQPIADAPAWLLGMMLWRGRSIPLLACEPLLGGSAGVGGVHARAVVCNTLNGNSQLPFIAVLSQGIPRLQELKSDTVEVVAAADDDSAVVAARLLLGGREAVIPDLDVMERQLLQLGVRVG
jgi:chemosensory pili system protein ChpC